MEHKTPSTEIFTEIKETAKIVWNTYDNTFGYVTEKLSIIDNIHNFEDNVMVCYRMFDCNNQAKMRFLLSEEANEYINQNQ